MFVCIGIGGRARMDEQPKPASNEVFLAIKRVMEDMAKAGVAKNQRNSQQNFQYRGVDDVMNALAPSLSKHGLIIVPHVRERTVTERASRAGGSLFHTVLKIDYDFIAANDGSMHVVGPIFGESMDSGDKATNKCMATAYKYATTQTFCIPFSGDDPDSETHEVVGAQAGERTDPQQQPHTAAPQATRQPAPPPRVETPNVAPKIPDEVPQGADGKPRILRPGGDFGYGKKFAQTPWSVMTTRDLEWFLGAERTPPNVRTKIAVELAWRDYETSLLDSARRQQAANDEASIASDDIPFDVPAAR